MPDVAFATLGTLSEALRDREWVDLGLCNGTVVQRVRIVAVIVRRDSDDLVVEQLAPIPDSIQRSEHTLDAEDVAWVRPTQVNPLDVKPIEPEPEDEPPRAAPLLTSPLIARYGCATEIAAICAATERVLGEAPLVPDPSNNYSALRARKVAMWCLYEMADVPRPDVALMFGYRSGMPMVTVAWNMKQDGGLREALGKVAKEAEKALGRRRRSVRSPEAVLR